MERQTSLTTKYNNMNANEHEKSGLRSYIGMSTSAEETVHLINCWERSPKGVPS
jgi:hypothetical protein